MTVATQTNLHPLRRLWEYAGHHRPSVLWASFCSVMNKLFDLAPEALIGAAVDVIVRRQDSFIASFGIPDVRTQFVVLAIATGVIWALESLFEYLYRTAWRNLAQTLQHELRLNAYAHVQDLELAYFEDRSTGGLMAILNDDINQLERFLDDGANQIIQVIVTTVVIGAIYLGLAPSVGWMALVPMPFIVWASVWFQGFLAPRYATVREQVGLLNSQLANNLGGIATIKSFTAEKFEIERIRHESDEYRLRNAAAIKLSSAFVPLIRMIIVAGFIAMLFFGGLMALEGRLNVGAYSIMVYITQRLLWPLTMLGSTFDLYQRAMASTARVFSLLDTQPQITSGGQSLPLATVRGEVVFDQVTFDYGMRSADDELHSFERRAVIRGLSLHIPAGETAAIVGATGAGKSTVIKLLLRFYDVQGGCVLLDGHDIRNLKTEDLRRAIGFVSQDVFLFHGTVRENIAYGKRDATRDEVIDAAKVAEAHDFIMQLPNGYDTVVGERGQKLSGGQRQRVSIARAVLKDPPVLILDEATSAVDNETEAAIQRSLERIAVGRTTTVIARRLSTVRNADRIFVLDSGQLREQGKHEALVAAGGIYAALWNVQTGFRARTVTGNGQPAPPPAAAKDGAAIRDNKPG